mmetsp:Transcript_53922/g.121852  ORF Transcript_53922/g.121852 Transcript_53922/m.121852 type:complete len:283 (-) Transcript_53922:379-1227(-)
MRRITASSLLKPEVSTPLRRPTNFQFSTLNFLPIDAAQSSLVIFSSMSASLGSLIQATKPWWYAGLTKSTGASLSGDVSTGTASSGGATGGTADAATVGASSPSSGNRPASATSTAPASLAVPTAPSRAAVAARSAITFVTSSTQRSTLPKTRGAKRSNTWPVPATSNSSAACAPPPQPSAWAASEAKNLARSWPGSSSSAATASRSAARGSRSLMWHAARPVKSPDARASKASPRRKPESPRAAKPSSKAAHAVCQSLWSQAASPASCALSAMSRNASDGA